MEGRPTTTRKSGKDLDNIREACAMLRQIKAQMIDQIEVGATTKYLDDYFRKETKALGGECAFLGYDDYPFAILASVNNTVVHGLPSNYKLKKGDVLGLDMGVRYRGMNSDSAFTVVVGGEPEGEVKRLIEGTKQAMNAGIEVVRHGVKTGDITDAVESTLRKFNLGAIYQLGGHGIGAEVHEGPFIAMSRAAKGTGTTLKSGMTICIEPMATLGEDEVYMDKKDGWSIKTCDDSIGAHFEETILVTDDGFEILT